MAAALVAVGCTESAQSDLPPRPAVAVSWMDSACSLPIEYLRRIRRGYTPRGGHDLQMVARPPNYFGGFNAWLHSGPWPHLQEIPLAFYGPGFIRSQGDVTVGREVTSADIAPTIAELIGAELPASRPGRPITEALLPADERPQPPRLVVTVVWDGGGHNVLNRWPDAWPELKAIMASGTNVTNAIVGSSPSITSAIHTNLGTGTYPREHGIIDIPIRQDGGFRDALAGMNPQNIRIRTLADIYDRSTGNAARVGMLAEHKWHLGMIGHGAQVEGGDRDIAVTYNRDTGAPITNREFFALPRYLERTPRLARFARSVDADDGKIDGKWLGHRLNNVNAYMNSPVFLTYQSAAIRLLLARERYGANDIADLFFTNFKQMDLLGHIYNMESREVESAIDYSDRALGELVEWLDANVGTNRWVLIVTADHGQTPRAETTGGWPIRISEVEADVARFMGLPIARVVQNARPFALWLSPRARQPINARRIARFLTNYRLKDNVPEGESVPSEYRAKSNSRIFAAAFPSRDLDRVWKCATN
jgi:hypothetical protein